MIRVIVTRLPACEYPWRYSLHIKSADPDEFQFLIDDLKSSIPGRSRKWDGDKRRWLFKADMEDALIALLKGHGALVDCEDEAQPAHRQLMSADEAAATLFLLPSAPAYIVDCVYRAMAKRLHPDAGGDEEQMKRINCAVEILRAAGER